MTLQERIKAVREKIHGAALRARRNPEEVTLILATKTVLPERIREAFEAGVRDFGENRVQELVRKKFLLPPEIRWHFVGNLQTNKVKFLLGEVVLLHSLDRLGLAEEIEKQARRKNLMMEALLQVNTTGEPAKGGFSPEALEGVLANWSGFSRIRLRGLMTMGPTPASFRKLRIVRDRLKERFPDLELRHLSMGMSSDFEIAVEEGATMVRIGTAVFGERKAE